MRDSCIFGSMKIWQWFLLFVLFTVFQPLHAACEQQEEHIKVALLLPLDDPNYPFVQSFMDGVMSGHLVALDGSCFQVEWIDYPTTQEGQLFIQQWYKMLEDTPDIAIGPLLPQHQQQLVGLDLSTFPESTQWLYPGDIEQLSVSDKVALIGFSLGQFSLVRTMLEFAWEQGQHDLALVLPESDQGGSIRSALM